MFNCHKVKLTFATFCVCVTSHGATYYMATNGNNSANGTSTSTPWLTLTKAAASMRAGDALFIRGGVYDCDPTTGTYQYFSPGYFTSNGGTNGLGTPSSPIVVSNYPGEVPVFINGNLSGVGIAPFTLGFNSWVKLFGLSASNCRGESITIVSDMTNCEIAYCTLGPSSTNAGSQGVFAFGSRCYSNYIHDCTFFGAWQNTGATNQVEGGDLVSFGSTTWYNYNEDTPKYNVLFRNVMYHGGHTALNPQGCAYTAIISNIVHNEVWISWPSFQQLGGHRTCGAFGGWNVYDSNDFSYAGNAIANGGAEGVGIFGQNNIVRRNRIHHNENNGLTLYDKAVGDGTWAVTNNHVFHNTFAHNALGQTWETNYYNLSQTNLGVPLPHGINFNNKCSVFLSGSTNSVFVNNIFAFNGGLLGTNSLESRGHTSVDDANAFTRTNFFNHTGGDPRFQLDSNDLYYWGYLVGNPFDYSNPNYRLQSTSPCIDNGTWLTTTVGSGSGTSLAVADSWYFWEGTTAAGVVFPGDTIQLEGVVVTAKVTAIDRSTHTLTLATSLSWTNGQGVALLFNGKSPDMGAYEYSGIVVNATVLNVGTFNIGQ